MDTNWEIESFNDYEFRDDNLYINVSWTNTTHNTLPEINSEMRSIAIVYKKEITSILLNGKIPGYQLLKLILVINGISFIKPLFYQ